MQITKSTIEAMNGAQLVVFHNQIPGVKPVKKFETRAIAIGRISKLVKIGVEEKRTAKNGTKNDKIITMLRHGASLQDLTTATGWQPHSVRGFLSAVVRKRLGMTLETSQSDDGRVYKIAL